MRAGHLSRTILVAGILSLMGGACGKSGSPGGGIGGTTAPIATTGGALNSGGSASGGTSGSGGATSSGGASATGATGGRLATGGATTAGPVTGGAGGQPVQSTGGAVMTGGTVGTGGGVSGGTTGSTGGARTGGTTGSAGRTASSTGGAATGGMATGGTTAAAGSGGAGGLTGTGGAAGGKGGGTGSGTCTPSKATSATASGSGPHKVTVETNSDPGINEGTIFRPTDLGGTEKYPIFVWGEGGCSQNGLSNTAAMAEIASYGYFVVADGTPNGSGNRTMDRSKLAAMGAPLMAYIDWAIAENDKPCSVYYQKLATTKIAANGFSCGGLMSQATVLDPRVTTWGVTSSGMAGAAQDFYDLIHTPILFVEGGTSDMAYDGAKEGYQAISKLTVPVLWFSKDLGHGGDLTAARGGDFTKLNLAWLNWWLKGDETSAGKGMLVGAACPYCSGGAWESMSKNIP